MAFPKTPTLVELATQILHEATILQAELDAHSLPQPSFAPSGRRDFHDILFNPTAISARTNLLEAIQTLSRLATGAADSLRNITNADRIGINVLRAIYELDLPAHVPLEGFISVSHLAAKVGCHPTPLRRILRFAYTMRIFQEPLDRPDHVGHTPFSAQIPAYGPYLWLQLGQVKQTELACHYYAWGAREENWPACPLVKADEKGRDMWTILHEDDPEGKGMSRFADAMQSAMQVMHGSGNQHFVEGFDWEGLGEGVVVDVGGGNGHNLVPVAQKFERLRFVVQDLEKNRGPFGELMTAAGLGEDRVQFIVHDFFTEQPDVGGEVKAYVLSRIFHDWPKEKCLKIVMHLLPEMRKGAKLFVVERVLPSRPGEIPVHQEAQLRAMDLMMYAAVPGGCERSRDVWEALFHDADAALKVKSVKTLPGSELSAMEVAFA